MKITTQYPEKEYPYLAVYGGGLNIEELENLFEKVKPEDIYIINMVEVSGSDNKVYCQRLKGHKEGYFIKNEEDYKPLPKGFTVTLTN